MVQCIIGTTKFMNDGGVISLPCLTPRQCDDEGHGAVFNDAFLEPALNIPSESLWISHTRGATIWDMIEPAFRMKLGIPELLDVHPQPTG